MTIGILLTLFLVLLNGFFVAAEFAIVKVRYSKIELRAKKGNRPATVAQGILDRLDAYLSATQLGITLASLGLGWIGEPVMSRLLVGLFHGVGLELPETTAHQIAAPIGFAIITILHIVFGELAPKSIAIRKAEETTLFVSWPMRIFYLIFKPFIWMLNGFSNFILRLIGLEPAGEEDAHTTEELRLLVKQTKESGAIKEDNYQIIQRAFDFSELTAQQVMVPRNRIFALDVETSREEVMRQVIENGYSRIPVYEGDTDSMIGMIFSKELLRANAHGENRDWALRDLLHPIQYVYATTRLNRVLKEFQSLRVHLGVVINEYGGTEGIISMEDILEELVGEIQDEFDDEKSPVQKNADGSFTISGIAPLHDINHFLPEPFPESRQYNTMNGMILNRFGRIPTGDEPFRIGDYEVHIVERRQNILTLFKVILQQNEGIETGQE